MGKIKKKLCYSLILMVAGALTKSLPSPAHIKHREIMLGHVPFSFAARTLRRSVGGGG
jgi:hypothetical protein